MDLVDDGTGYSEEDQEFIEQIQRKNLKRKKKAAENVVSKSLVQVLSSFPDPALLSDSCESDMDTSSMLSSSQRLWQMNKKRN